MTGDARSFGIEEASRRLGEHFTVDWLRGHLSEIPHLKLGKGSGRGGRVAFTDAHLDRILTMFTIEPEAGSDPGDFTPISRRRSA